MSTIKSNKTTLLFILFSIFLLMAISCEKKIKPEKSIPNTKIEAQVLIEIAESNLKVTAITQKAQENKMSSTTRAVFEQVEKDHIQIKNNIKKIAKNNFIIIPNTLYDTNALKSFISEANIYMYLKKTEDLLLAELEQYKTIAATNKDLKKIATASIFNIQKNISIIQKEVKLQQQ